MDSGDHCDFGTHLQSGLKLPGSREHRQSLPAVSAPCTEALLVCTSTADCQICKSGKDAGLCLTAALFALGSCSLGVPRFYICLGKLNLFPESELTAGDRSN